MQRISYQEGVVNTFVVLGGTGEQSNYNGKANHWLVASAGRSLPVPDAGVLLVSVQVISETLYRKS